MLRVIKEEITEGPISRTLVLLALPLVAQSFAMVAQQVVDTFWLGRLGADAVAAVGLVIPIGSLIGIPMMVGFSGSQIITAQYVGNDETDVANRVPVNAALLLLSLASAMAALTFLFAEDVLSFLYPNAQFIGMSTTYLIGFGLAFIPGAVSDGLESGFMGYGDTRAVFLINLTAIIINIVLDPFLIFGWWIFPAWDVFGAAVATGIGYGVGGVLAVAFALRGHYQFTLTPASLQFDTGLCASILRTGTPLAIKQSGQMIARAIMVSIVTIAGGAAALAAYTIGARLASIAFVPASGLASAVTTMVGQNIGSNAPRRAERITVTGVIIGGIGLTAFGVVQWLIPGLIAEVFIPGIDGMTRELTIDYLRILTFGYWAFAAIFVVNGGFNGAGRTDLSMYSTLIQYWVVRIPFAAIGVFVLGVGAHAVYWSITVSNILAGFGLLAFYVYSTNNRLFDNAADAATSD